MNHTGNKPARIYIGLFIPAIIIVAGVVVDSIGFFRGGHAGIFSIPGFWSVFGLLGCLALAGVCKLAARLFLKRSENYYDDVL